jgi:uncharacterized membrane protein
LGLIATSLFLRIYYINLQPLSPNEWLSVCISNGICATSADSLEVDQSLVSPFTQSEILSHSNLKEVTQATVYDSGNAVAYNWMLHLWTGIFGNSVNSVRSLSLTFGILTLILGYYFCRQLFNERTAILAGVLLSLHPLLIEYAQIARAYVPATFFILLATYSLYQVAVAKRHLWLHIPLYVLVLVIALLSHYVTIYIFITHVLLVALFHSHRKALVQYGVMAVIGFSLFSVWLFNGGWAGKRPMNIEKSMWQQHMPVNGEAPNEVYSFGQAFIDLGLNTLRIFGNDIESTPDVEWLYLFMLSLPAIALVFAFKKVRKSEFFRPTMFVLFPLVSYIAFAFTMAIRSGHTIPLDIRYTIFVVPFACMLLAFGLDRMMDHRRILQPLAFCLFGTMAAIMFTGFFPGVLRAKKEIRSEEWRIQEEARAIIEVIQPNDTLKYTNNHDAILTNILLPGKITNIQFVDSTSTGTRIIRSGKQISPLPQLP